MLALLAAASIIAQYNDACAEAKAGHKDRALAIVEQVATAGVFPAEQFENDPDLASLRDEPRFKAAMVKAAAAAHPCQHDPRARELDFWVGEWDVFNPAGVKVGQSKVESILAGCVVLENWTARVGHAGKSFNLWDRAAGEWRQTWVNDQGQLTEYHGRFEDGAMRFLAKDGAKWTRLVFTRLPGGSVRQFFETSADAGRTWTPSFDGKYVRR